jgi:hypothetical protein
MFFQALYLLLGSQVCQGRRPEPADPGSYGMLLEKDWSLLAAVSTDATEADSLASDVNAPQQGSGSLDVPYYVGDKYMFIAVAPDDTWSNSEYPTYLYSAGYQSWGNSGL